MGFGMDITVQIFADLTSVKNSSAWPFILLGFALLIALGFEFVNGFHDTANAVATVIYTHSLPPHIDIAVVWSGVWNFVGVMLASGAVAFAEQTGNIRNDMYLISEALRQMDKLHDPSFAAADYKILKDYRSSLDKATKFIPAW
jgi:hypothetical protein